MPGWRAGSPIAEYAQVQCREPKTGQERFNSIVKTIGFEPLTVLLLFIYVLRILVVEVTGIEFWVQQFSNIATIRKS